MGQPGVVTFPPNVGEKRGGQERQTGENDVYGRARDVSFPPIINEKKGKYGTLVEPQLDEKGCQWKDHRSMLWGLRIMMNLWVNVI